MFTTTSVRRRILAYYAGATFWILGLPGIPDSLALHLVVFVALAVFALTIRCPRCRESVFNRRVRAFGETWDLQGPFPVWTCSTCGLGFRRSAAPPAEEASFVASPEDWTPRKWSILLTGMGAASATAAAMSYVDGLNAWAVAAAAVAGLWFTLALLVRRSRGRAGH